MAGLASELSLNQTAEFIARLGRAGLTLERAKLLMSDDNLVAQWVNAFPVKTLAKIVVYEAVVNRSQTWADMFTATKIPPRNISSDFTAERFPFGEVPTYEYDLVLVEFGHDPSWDDLLAEYKSQGLEQPEVEDGLAFAAAHPDVQRQFPIIVPISRPWRPRHGAECVPCLDGSEFKRYLHLYDVHYSWGQCFQFLARRPRKPACPEGRSK